LLAGKYKSEEDLDKGFQSLVDKYGKEKAYKMLEKGMSDSSQNADTKDNKIDDKSTQTKDVLSVDDDTGGDTGGDDKINFEKFYTEYAENEGKLSEDSYKELNEMGFDEDTVNAFMTGQEAKSELYTLKVYEMAGSKEQWNAMIDWSTTALSSGEKTKFNDAIKSNDLGSAKVVIDALKHRYTQSQGTFKRQALESSDGDVFTAGVVGYESVEQMKRDMNDPKYKAGDQAFHKQVMAKIAASAIM